MAKCVKCSRKGLFFKVGLNVLCNDCAALEVIAAEKNELRENVNNNVKTPNDNNQINKSVITHRKIFTSKMIDQLKERYIAFDVETTGLNPKNDRIIEIGAVLFEKGVPTKEYGSLINAGVHIPISASKVNHITDQMIQKAPSEKRAYAELVKFLGDSLNANTVICAHNADFDMGFLSETLKRVGYTAEINYVDTLSLSQKSVFGVQNYKLPTLARHFGIVHEQAHRAVSDAKTCGLLLAKILSAQSGQSSLKSANEIGYNTSDDKKRWNELSSIIAKAGGIEKQSDNKVNISVLLSDDFVRQAAVCAIDAGEAGVSVAYLQRKLKASYARAAIAMDKLEDLGIVGPFEGVQPRRVLVNREWLTNRLEESALAGSDWLDKHLQEVNK